MSRKSVIISTLLAMNTLCAQEPSKEGEKKRRSGEGRPGRESMLKSLDTDKDGKISFEEFAAGKRVKALDLEVKKKLFGRLDKDKDGMIAGKELKTPPDGRDRGRGEGFPPFREMDTNKDHQVTFEEFAKHGRAKGMSEEQLKRFFSRLDENKDGVLSRKDHSKSDRDSKGRRGPSSRMGLKEYDLDGDGKLSLEEFSKSPMGLSVPEADRAKLFQKLDKDGDGFLTGKELHEARKESKK